MAENSSPIKEQPHALIDNLPDTASWDDLADEFGLRASIERGLADAQAGRVVPANELTKEFGIEE
ncbi:MAG: hypothetical protein ACREUL_20165 [Steroidobacteraceae bacterium]